MPGTLYSPSQGQTDILRNILSVLGGTPGNYGGKGELMEAILTSMQSYQSPGAGAGALTSQPAGTLAATHDRAATSFAQAVSAGASGTLNLTAIYIPANTVVTNINYVMGSTGSTGVTHNWGVLADLNLKVLAVTADNTATDRTASTAVTQALTAPFTTTYSGLYYVGVAFAVATTQPTFQGQSDAATTVMNIAPKVSGSSNTGVTTPVATGATLTAITTTVGSVYFFLT